MWVCVCVMDIKCKGDTQNDIKIYVISTLKNNKN